VMLSRIALTEEDMADPALPYFSADSKRTDSRYGWYVPRYGRRCAELDALSPIVLRDRVEAAIRGYIDWPLWERCEKAERAEQSSLVDVMTAWNAALGRMTG